MIVNVHAGHNPDGKVACGAVGLIKESTAARNVKDAVIDLLRKAGHTVYDCTVDNGTSQNDVLKKIKAKCDEHPADLNLSIHFNAGGGHGCEAYILNNKVGVKHYAEDICENIAKLGFKNRGVKTSSTLYVLKNIPNSVLVECCFVDSAEDVKLYNANKMASAIFTGITGMIPVCLYDKPESNKPAAEYKVKVTANTLNVRKGPGTDYSVFMTIVKNGVYTIVEESADGAWGKLKSGAGWINLKYVQKI